MGRYVVAEALRAAGATVVIHDDCFDDPTTEDPPWIKLCGERRWVAMTKDDSIRYHELSKQVLLAGGVPVFTLNAQGISGPEMAAIFVAALAKIERVVKKQAPGYIAYVTRTAKIGRILTAKDLAPARALLP